MLNWPILSWTIPNLNLTKEIPNWKEPHLIDPRVAENMKHYSYKDVHYDNGVYEQQSSIPLCAERQAEDAKK